MATLAQRGVQISKNAVFSLLLGRASKLLGKPFKIFAILNEAADKLANENSKDNKFKQLFDVALTLVRMVRDYVKGDYRQIQSSTIVSGVAVLLYVINPIDLVPDFIPVLGFLDDLSLISWFMGKFQKEIANYREWEMQASAATPSNAALGDASQPAIAELGHS
ncbi:MAG: DUF1232 domain-containing protein [Hymenobacter sp.]|nr:MAG: DUF1232 domain-containing protein [Hymenobacter sp.]